MLKSADYADSVKSINCLAAYKHKKEDYLLIILFFMGD